MDAMQAPNRQAVIDRARTEAQAAKLAPGYDAVLSRCNLRDLSITWST